MMSRLSTRVVIGLAAMSLAACGSVTGSHGASPVPSPTASRQPSPALTAVTGQATTSSGAGLSGVAVGFKLTTAVASCDGCGYYTAATGQDGTYTAKMPVGSYRVACLAGSALTCQVGTSASGSAPLVPITGSTAVVNLLVTPKLTQPTPQPGHQADQGNVASGFVRTEEGQPVAGVAVEFRNAACPDCLPQPNTTTNTSGAYSITLPDGVYSAECSETNCGPQGGNGGPFPINVPPGRTLNFVFCSNSDYPACLTH
jgi:hypothetical protein